MIVGGRRRRVGGGGVVHLAALVPLAAVPVEPGREEARGLAIRELAKREYAEAQPDLAERVIRWVIDKLTSVELPAGPGPAIGVTLLLLLAAAAIAFAVTRYGYLGLRGRRREDRSVLGTSTLSAAEHRSAAESHATAERWAPAVLERFRAVARELEERAVLTRQPGRTADEIAQSASRWLPSLADGFRSAARIFDDVRYGDRPGSAAGYARIVELDDAVRRTRPTETDQPRPGAVAVPA